MKNLKFIAITLTCIFCATSVFAQLEVKSNPLSFAFGRPVVSVEYIPDRHLGVELFAGTEYGNITTSGIFDPRERLTKSGYNFRFMGKYYLEPRVGGDWFYLGIYGGTKKRIAENRNDDAVVDNGWIESVNTYGFAAGFKWVTPKGFLIEVNIGGGKAFNYTFESSGAPNTNRGLFNGFDANANGSDFFAKTTVGYRF